MGASVGIHFKTVKEDNGLVKCVPCNTFTKFPEELKQPAGALILETEAYPMKLGIDTLLFPGSVRFFYKNISLYSANVSFFHKFMY